MTDGVEMAAAPPSGWRITPLGWAAYALAAVVAGLDQASKYWVLNVLHLADSAITVGVVLLLLDSVVRPKAAVGA